MINKQEILDFVAASDFDNPGSAHLYSFSRMVAEDEYSLLSKKLLGSDFLFYWSDPSDQHTFLAYGEVYAIKGNTFTDLSYLDEQLQNLPFNILSNNGKITESKDPLFFGGIKFPSLKSEDTWNDFEFAKWSMPQILLIKNGNDFKITINTFKHDLDGTFSIIEHSEYEFDKYDETQVKILSSVPNIGINEWSVNVESALAIISNTKLNKMVLSRYEKIELSSTPNIRQQLKKLETTFGNCITFAYQSKGSVFFGATPEKLFSVKDSFLEADALAGSIQRGANEEEDENFKNLLLHDEKNLAEHKSVVDFILHQLTPVTEKILFDSQPSIKAYSNIQHLYSQIRAKIKNDVSFFSLLEKLYPTPAVCGFPRKEALNAIHKLETFDRGLFAGALGWFNLNGNAEFSVGIRSALLRNNQLQAYAGCGIVDGSDSLSEFNETELKLKPILNLFANETVHKS